MAIEVYRPQPRAVLPVPEPVLPPTLRERISKFLQPRTSPARVPDIVTNVGNKTGAVRKTPLMRVEDGGNYVLVGSVGGAPKNPVWVYNLRANPLVEIRDRQDVRPMRVREVMDPAERSRLWALAVQAFPPYADYQQRTTRKIPVFVAEPV